MSGKTVSCVISHDLVPTRPDNLSSDCLRIEVSPRLVLHPGTQSRLNICVHNSSSEGRMAKVVANFDPRQATVNIPDADVYVAPSGKTTIFALITPIAISGEAKITFDVF